MLSKKLLPAIACVFLLILLAASSPNQAPSHLNQFPTIQNTHKTDCKCSYGGKEYSVGATVCMEGTQKECDKGKGDKCEWFATGKACK